MAVTDVQPAATLDDFLEAFEKARAEGDANIATFLPPPEHPDYHETLVELIRVDLELSWQARRPTTLGSYREQFNDIFDEPSYLAAIAFEEYRLRRAAGEACDREEYSERHGIDTSTWADLPVGPENVDADADERWLGELSDVDGSAAQRLSEATSQLPEVGDRLLDFELVGELGRGAFGRAFLARQGDLANRFVALKVTAQVSDEPQHLAQLQHTNIVPIYSLHRHGSLQVVCMPFLGPNTLADVLGAFQTNRAIPLSGNALVSTVAARQVSTVVMESGAEATELSGDEVSASETLRRLGKMSYLDAASWIVAKLASGLAHAHEHGIIHRDLKPANVLLSDDGEPMILDFNLSSSSSLRSTALVGGTLPYMSPDHLKALRNDGDVGPADDIYSLGVILFEMVTGQLPYPIRRGSFEQVAAEMLDDRKTPAPSVRALNHDAPTDLSTIVAKCLATSPQDRYATAADLQEDLERHIEQYPLIHAPNRSFRERLRKWRHRHPRLTSTGSTVGLASVIIAALVLAFLSRGRIIAKQHARRQAEQFLEQVATAGEFLNVPEIDRQSLDDAVAAAQETAGTYRLLDEKNLETQTGFRLLSDVERERVRLGGAELMYLLGGGQAMLATRSQSGRQREERYAQALSHNERAAALLPDSRLPKAFLLQRARILDAMGETEAAENATRQAETTSSGIAFDRYLMAVESSRQRKHRDSIDLLEQVLLDKPQDYSAWFGLGSAHFSMRNFTKAEGCYTTAIALKPKLPLAYLMRGVTKLKLSLHEEAITDFDRTLQLRPRQGAALVNRALARRAVGDVRAAIDDLTQALSSEVVATRIYFLRAKLKKELGDVEGAEADRAEGLRLTPTDELSWIARGIAKLRDDPEGSLADFQQALQLNPQSTTAMQNKAHVLSARLDRSDEAVRVMNELVESAHDQSLARANRGVLLARLGREKEAVADATAAVAASESPAVVYRVGCIYALLDDDPEDPPRRKTMAVQYVRQALREQPALFATALRDEDLTSLRELPAFRQVISAAHILNQKPAGASGAR